MAPKKQNQVSQQSLRWEIKISEAKEDKRTGVDSVQNKGLDEAISARISRTRGEEVIRERNGNIEISGEA